jgi:DNA-binding GntR family transcriptional regulator
VTVRVTIWEGFGVPITTVREALTLLAPAKAAANITNCSFFILLLYY